MPTQPMMRWIYLGCFVAAGWAFNATAAYPERPITLVVCFPPGGSTDLTARILATPLGELLGQPVVIVNRPGAGGNIAMNAVAKAPADGYTLLMCSSAFVLNPSLYANATYDPIKDFAPVVLVGASPNVLTVPGKSDFNAMADLIGHAKQHPGKLNWTSSGVGTTPYLSGEIFLSQASLKVVHIPFAGAGPATTAAIAGQVDFYFASLGSVMSLIKAGKLKAIAVTSKKRWPSLPNTVSLNELGFDAFEMSTFQAIFAPAGAPQEVVERLAKESARALARSDITEKLAQAGIAVVPEGPNALRSRVAGEVPFYSSVVRKIGLKPL